ncbi:4-hydroxy-tetrahydrodipicolinate synthase [Ruminococcaceae bacterium OttesenSCG-928-I18]|nr:4-hydroxy-tetrahydrodipicolinate synthase [Ruminococcaceae bacterium OttesenSCG-928-I18]
MYRLSGVVPAMVTPFCEDSSINEEVFRELVNVYIEAGCHALGVGGGTGEYVFMSTEERKQLIKICMEEVAGRVPVIAGTGCHSTEETIELSQFADNLGAAACLVITPHYNKTNDEGLYQHYKRLNDSVTNVGIVLYNYPDGTNVDISPSVVHRLAGEKNIIGIKSSTCFDSTMKMIHATEDYDNFGVFTGFEGMLVHTLISGGTGTYGVVQDIVPKAMVKMYELALSGKINEAMKLHDKYYKLFDMVYEEPSPGPVKAALSMLGFKVGNPRMPILPASDDFLKKMRNAMEEMDIL